MYIILILGFIFLLIGIRNKKKKKKLLSEGNIIEGTIIRLDENEINDRTIYHPVVQVKDHKSKFHEIRLSTGTTWPKKIGTLIKIVFDPDNPHDAFEARKSSFSAETIFIIIGSILTFIGIIAVIFSMVWNEIIN